MKDKISIIIPVYNSELYLEECIDSVINQTYKELEIILVNDGSTDSSLNVCNKYKNNNKIMVLDLKHQGVSNARNEGIKKSTGKYIMFLDSDDYFSKDYVEKMYNAAKEGNDLVISGFNYFSNKSSRTIEYSNISKKIEKNEAVIGLIQTSYFNSISKIMVNSKIIKDNKILFDTKLKYFEDYKFSFQIINNSQSIYYLSNCLYNYRIHDNSSTRIKDINQIDKWFDDSYSVLDYIEKNYHEHKQLLINKKFNNLIITFKVLTKIKKTTYREYKNKIKTMLKDFYKVIPKESINISEIVFDRKINKMRAKLIYKDHLLLFYIYSKIENLIVKVIR